MKRKTIVYALAMMSVLLTGLHLAGAIGEERPPIATDNAGQMTALAVLARGWINNLAWTPDGESLAVIGSAGVWLHDADDFDSEPRLIPGHDDTWSAAFSPDMSLIAMGGRNSTVYVSDVATGEVLHELACREGDGVWAAVQSIAFSPDSSLLACGAGDVLLFDVATGEHLATFEEDYAAVFSPDGIGLVTAGAGNEVRLWELSTYELLVTFLTDDDCSWGIDLDFSPDRAILAAVSRCGTARAWPMPAGFPDLDEAASVHPMYVLDGHGGEGWNRVAFGPDWTTLVVGGLHGADLLLWDMQQAGPFDTPESESVRILTLYGETSGVENFYGVVVGAAYSPDGSTAAIATSFGDVGVWDADTGEQIALLREYNPGGWERGGAYHDGISITRVAFNPDGNTLAAGTGGYMTSGGTAQFWDVEQRVQTGYLPGSGSMLDMAYSPDGSLLATTSAFSLLRVWDMDDASPTFGEVLYAPEDSRGDVMSVAFSPDGETLATGGGSTVYLSDAETGEALGELENEVLIREIAYSPDGSLLAVGCDDGTVRLWSIEQGEMLTVLEAHPDSLVASLAFNPDGSVLATAGGWGDDTVKLWDVGAGEKILTLEADVESVAFSLDGSLLATGGGWNSDTLLLWDVTDDASPTFGERLATLDGHTMSVESIAFSPDGSLLVSGGWDGTVRLWGVPANP